MSGDRDAIQNLCRLLRRAARDGWDGITLNSYGYIEFYGAGIARDGSDQFSHKEIPDAQCTALREAITRRIHHDAPDPDNACATCDAIPPAAELERLLAENACSACELLLGMPGEATDGTHNHQD